MIFATTNWWTESSTLLITAIAGACWGSFINQCVDRSPKGRQPQQIAGHPLTWWHPLRSLCLACHQPLRWQDNLPIISWWQLKGTCRTCGSPFGIRTLLMESGFALGWPLLLLWEQNYWYWLVPSSLVGLLLPLLLEKRSLLYLWPLWLILTASWGVCLALLSTSP